MTLDRALMRKTLLMGLAITLVFATGGLASASPVPPDGTFVDDDGSVHEASIEAIAQAAITSGCATLQFCPNDPVTRGQRAGTPGSGNGGSITLDGVAIYDSNAREGGGGIFFVSNNRTGTLTIRNSVLRRNVSERFETAGLPGIFVLSAGTPAIENSIIE